MKDKRLLLQIMISGIFYILVSAVFVYAENNIYKNAVQIYTFELFCVPFILAVVLLFYEKEKRIVLYIFDAAYAILALVLVICLMIHRPLTVTDGKQMLEQEGYKEIQYISSYQKESYNNGIAAFAKGNLEIELPECKLGVYVYEGTIKGKDDMVIVYLENGKHVSLSESDKSGMLKNILSSKK